jgi:hypothetical protein
VIAVREGINAWRGNTCCPAPVNAETIAGEHNCDCCDN